jgi:alkaline phosphatase D
MMIDPSVQNRRLSSSNKNDRINKMDDNAHQLIHDDSGVGDGNNNNTQRTKGEVVTKEETHHHQHHSLPEHIVSFQSNDNYKNKWQANNNKDDQEEEEPEIHHRFWIVRYNKYMHSVVTTVLALALVMVLSIGHSSTSSTTNSVSSFSSSVNPTEESPTVYESSFVATTSAADIPWMPLPDSSQRISRIAFGSCMKEDMPMPFWDTLLEYQPDITILGGDNVYSLDVDACSGVDNCTLLELAYQQLNHHASFQGAKRQLPMVAMLDDHDYGINDCHRNNPYKDIAKQLYFDFMDIPLEDERRHRIHEGLYTSYEWGKDDEIVQLILLDTRYSRSEFIYDDELEGYVPYSLDEETGKRFLSDAQWHWFEQVLQRPANVRLILSTQQVLTQGVWGFESWNNIPKERHRLVKLLKQYCSGVGGDPTSNNNTNTYKPSLPILLSGDRHVGAFYNDPALWADLFEVTASSWTHTIPDGWFDDGSKCKTQEECIEPDPTRLGDWVGVNHFGMVQVDWEQRMVNLSLIQTETSHGYYVRQRWEHNTDAGQVLKSMTLPIP